MNRRVRFAALCAVVAVLLLAGCSGSGEDSKEKADIRQTRIVEDFVRVHVTKTGDEGVYDIPPRGGHDVSGKLTGLHTVYRKDADNFFVCADFENEDDRYDVDFLVRIVEGQPELVDRYLHKVNGEVVE